jgi:hypothetical protein
MSNHGFFPVGYKEFGSLLITDYTSAVNNTGYDKQNREAEELVRDIM